MFGFNYNLYCLFAIKISLNFLKDQILDFLDDSDLDIDDDDLADLTFALLINTTRFSNYNESDSDESSDNEFHMMVEHVWMSTNKMC